MKKYTLPDIRNEMKRLGYAFFEDGDYNLNLIGVRNKSNIADGWDDHFYVIYKVNGKWNVFAVYEFTTDPGKLSLTNPVFNEAIKNGTAILKEGQYRGAYKYSFHIHKSHPALVQIKPVTIYRDNNRDGILDTKNMKQTTGLYGINIHSTRPGWNGNRVVNWSAGCQVIKNWNIHKQFIQLIEQSVRRYGDVFTYTLLDEF